MSIAWTAAHSFPDSVESNSETWHVGDLVTMNSPDGGYDVSTIIGFAVTLNGTWARLARPYAYAHTIGSSAGVLTGVEIYEVSAERLGGDVPGLGRSGRTNMRIGSR